MSASLTQLRTWLFLCLASWSLLAMADVPVPTLTHRVTDLTGTLTPQQQQTLEQSLQAFEARKGSQIALLIVPSTAPEAIEQYSIRVVEQWKLGRKNVDDGALLLIAKNDRTLRIEVGYGLEGALNDATCQRIISEIIVPAFKQGDFYGGIQAGLERMIKVVDGEPLPPVQPQVAVPEGVMQVLPILFVVALIGGSILRSIFGSLFGALLTGGLIGLLAWLLTSFVVIALIAGIAAAFFTLIGNNVGMGGGYYRGGGSGGGGFGGGGFSGGGGGFGGGGASGRW